MVNQTRTSTEMWVERSGLNWVRDKLIAAIAGEISRHPITRNTNDLYFYESRIIRYDEGQYLKPHLDNDKPLPASVDPDHGGLSCYYGDGKKKLLTIVIYLNDDYEGGELRFSELYEEIKPSSGELVMFPPNFFHEGKPVTKGTKYIMVCSVFCP